MNQNFKIKILIIPVSCIFRNFEKSNLKWKIILISVYKFTKKKKTKNQKLNKLSKKKKKYCKLLLNFHPN